MESIPERQRGAQQLGSPRGQPLGWLQHFLCHRALTAKINTSFERKSVSREICILEKELVRESLCWPKELSSSTPTFAHSVCERKSEGPGNEGLWVGPRSQMRRGPQGSLAFLFTSAWLWAFNLYLLYCLVGGIAVGLLPTGSVVGIKPKSLGTVSACLMWNGGCEFY